MFEFKLKACIVCFSSSSRLLDIDCVQLKIPFYELSGLQPADSLMKTQYLCVECSELVKKFHNFREKCGRAHMKLIEIITKAKQVIETGSSIKNVSIAKSSHLDLLRDPLANDGDMEVKDEMKLEPLAPMDETPSICVPIDDSNETTESTSEDEDAYNDVNNETIEPAVDHDYYEEEYIDDTIFESDDEVQPPPASNEIENQSNGDTSNNKDVIPNNEPDNDVELHILKLSCRVCRKIFNVKADKVILQNKNMVADKFVCKVCLPLVKSNWEAYKDRFENQNNTQESLTKDKNNCINKIIVPDVNLTKTKNNCIKEVKLPDENLTKTKNSVKKLKESDLNLTKTKNNSFKEIKVASENLSAKNNYNKIKKRPADFPAYSPVSQEEQYRVILDRKYKTNKQVNHRCQICYKTHTCTIGYERHMKKHDQNISGNLQCDMCKEYKINKTRMIKHMYERHINKWTCTVNGCKYVTYHRSHATAHYRYHKNITFQCQHCGQIYKKKSSYLSHIRYKHPSANVICNLCGNSFIGELGVIQHKNLTHTKEEIELGEKLVVDSTSELYCSYCKVQFVYDKAFETHVYSSCKLNAYKPIIGAKVKRNAQEKKTFMCPICGRTISQYQNMLYHMNTHTKEKPFECPQCDRKFSMPSNRARHLVTHTGEKPFMCQYCSRCFGYTTSLKLHIRTVHMKIPYEPWIRQAQKKRLARLERKRKEDDEK